MLYLIALAGIAAISSSSILIKLCHAPAMVIACYRMGLAAALFVGSSAARQHNPFKQFNLRDLGIALGSAVFLCLHFAAWITSLQYTSVASSVALVTMAPLFVAIGSALLLKEKPGRLLLAGIGITVVGALILSSNDFGRQDQSLWGNFLAILGAIGGAGYLLAGRELRKRVDTLAYVTVVYTMTAIMLIAITLLSNLSFTAYPPKVFLLFFLIAFLPQVIGHTSFNWLLKHLSAIIVSIFTLTEPVGASILAYFILGENIGWAQVIGGGFILTGVAISLRGDNERPGSLRT